ncbi:MAG: flagellin FliC [Nitrospinae bacterium]|nr:flagellin FliC [Nitrospinota bacterium]MZH04668.1 flagellin FliC [Nitrospinota bacterium]MZH14009.1 flagellin FliC [Nitrospinota bacterium]
MGGLVINTNLSSLNSQRVLENSNRQLGKSINRISSGIKIEGATDGVGELALSESLRSDIAALKQGSRNVKNGTALLNMAEGALNEISGILLRLRSLASQSANGTLAETERQAVNLEFQASLREIDRIVGTTEFNGTFLLNGTLSKTAEEHIVLQAGVDSSSRNQIDLNDLANLNDVSTSSLNLNNSEITTQGSAFLALNDLTQAIDTMLDARGRLGTAQIRSLHAMDALNAQIENLTDAVSTIRDVDLAEELTTLTKNQLLVQAGVAMVGQANINPQAALTLLEGV